MQAASTQSCVECSMILYDFTLWSVFEADLFLVTNKAQGETPSDVSGICTGVISANTLIISLLLAGPCLGTFVDYRSGLASATMLEVDRHTACDGRESWEELVAFT